MGSKSRYAKEEMEVLRNALNEHKTVPIAELAELISDDLAAVSESAGRPRRSTKAIYVRLLGISSGKFAKAASTTAAPFTTTHSDLCGHLKAIKSVFDYYQDALKAAKQREKDLVEELRKLRDIRQAVERYAK